MKRLITLLILICLPLFLLKAQTVKMDSKGNYVAVKDTSKAKSATLVSTGKTYTDPKGEVYPVYTSSNGKLFVMKTSKKTNNTYRSYLKL